MKKLMICALLSLSQVVFAYVSIGINGNRADICLAEPLITGTITLAIDITLQPYLVYKIVYQNPNVPIVEPCVIVPPVIVDGKEIISLTPFSTPFLIPTPAGVIGYVQLLSPNAYWTYEPTPATVGTLEVYGDFGFENPISRVYGVPEPITLLQLAIGATLCRWKFGIKR